LVHETKNGKCTKMAIIKKPAMKCTKMEITITIFYAKLFNPNAFQYICEYICKVRIFGVKYLYHLATLLNTA
jgi:hypothetical protein